MSESKKINSSDKINLIITGVLVGSILLSVVFFNLSRRLPLLYLFLILEVVELFYTIPTVTERYFKLYGMNAGKAKWIPYYNVISIFNKPFAVASVIIAAITFVVAFIAFGPMFWVTMKDISVFAELQYRAYGWFVVSLLVWSLVIGAGYISVASAVAEMRAEFVSGNRSKLEFANYAMLLLPVARGFSLQSLLSSMKMLLDNGYEYGKDYTALDLEEE